MGVPTHQIRWPLPPLVARLHPADQISAMTQMLMEPSANSPNLARGGSVQSVPDPNLWPRRVSASIQGQVEAMLFRFVEVVSVLTLITLLLIAKHIPVLSSLPLSQATGIVCFAFAIFLSLKIYGAELKRLRAEE